MLGDHEGDTLEFDPIHEPNLVPSKAFEDLLDDGAQNSDSDTDPGESGSDDDSSDSDFNDLMKRH